MATPVRILIVEDSEIDTELLVRELDQAGYAATYERVQTAETMQEALRRASWDLVISDYNMPTFSAPEALAVLQASGLDLPFIIVSGTIGEETAVNALKAGAHDFLIKGRLLRLGSAIERELREVAGRRERAQLEEQLRQALKLEALGQLAGGVAHDINNVLTAILGFTYLITEAMFSDDPARNDLLEIKKASERAAGLTRQLLAFSRKQILQPKVLDINAVTAGMESMLKRLIFEHVNLTVSPAADLGLIMIDPTQLEQILVNLVVNAADAMPRGGTLTIETANVTLDEQYQQRHLPVAPGDYVMLAVGDTGVGMDDITRRRIFEPFFTTKDVGKGTGLGLSTVYGIVKQSGGDILVESEPGQGSTFRIYFPRLTAPAVPAMVQPAGPGESPRGSETVLVVEDDEGVQHFVCIMLERAGYLVLHAGNPKEAMLVAGEFPGPIHLLLSDVIMPESEGLPLFDRLATIQPGLRVLYMSGHADEAIIRQGLLVEGMAFLQKPFTPLVLARKVREVLEARPLPAAG